MPLHPIDDELFNQTRQKLQGRPAPTLLSKDKYIFTQHSRDQEHTSHVNFNRIFYSRSETQKDRNADPLYITQAEK